MIKLSVIIPVFNCAPYVGDCLQSLIRQTEANIQIICINDGSTDESLNILNEYACLDSRIQIINQKNNGVSIARNAGIEVAKGEYIGFVDADDSVKNDYFDKFLSQIKDKGRDIDIIATPLADKWPNLNAEIYKVHDRKYIKETLLPYLLRNESFNSTCTKIYRKEIIDKCQIRFPQGIKLGEDGTFNILFLKEAQNCLFINNDGYYYRERIGSATRDILNNNYFKIAFDTYKFEHKKKLNLDYSSDSIKCWKTEKLFNSLLAAFSIYLRRNETVSFSDRKKIIIQAINNPLLNACFALDWNKIISGRNRFEIFILKSLKGKSFIRIRLAYLYVHWRNHIK